MKIKLDENLADHGQALLAAEGYDVMTVREQRLSGAPDAKIYEVCREEGRVLVTLDHDFGQTLRFPPDALSGIIILECRGRQSRAGIQARLRQLISLLRTRKIDREL
ncbi:MAG: DUF5615 family PIN-like protein [Hyphomicrobium sp.]